MFISIRFSRENDQLLKINEVNVEYTTVADFDELINNLYNANEFVRIDKESLKAYI